MSSTSAENLRRLFDEFIAATGDMSTREAATTLGVHHTYIAKLRTGWRPARVRDELWRNLAHALSKPAYGVVSDSGSGYGSRSPDYYRGQQDLLTRLMRWIVAEQSKVGYHLETPTGLALEDPDDED